MPGTQKEGRVALCFLRPGAPTQSGRALLGGVCGDVRLGLGANPADGRRRAGKNKQKQKKLAFFQKI